MFGTEVTKTKKKQQVRNSLINAKRVKQLKLNSRLTHNSLLDRLDPTFHKKAHPPNVYLFIVIYLHLLLSSISYFLILICR